ncbi:glycosyltransferase family A protein [Pedobacter suwonensis]|uniref:glycosyltransferase family A protein n=1 Tax=Pedobacter suwonensis TaxID=332999 RepID=UPI0031453F12
MKNQSVSTFEWIVVDDGSTDETQAFFESIQSSKLPFKLKYEKQENAGKHIAINRGVQLAETDIFFIVDSDDFLVPDTVEVIKKEWLRIDRDDSFAGIAFNRCFPSGEAIGAPQYEELNCSPLEFRYKYKEIGDKAEIIRTSLFKKYPFPLTKGEKFCPEALFFNRLKDFNLMYLNMNKYVCDYQPDGLTAKIFSIRMKSPVNTCLCYAELASMPIPLFQKFRALVNFYRFKRYTGKSLSLDKTLLLMKPFAKVAASVIYELKDKKSVNVEL